MGKVLMLRGGDYEMSPRQMQRGSLWSLVRRQTQYSSTNLGVGRVITNKDVVSIHVVGGRIADPASAPDTLQLDGDRCSTRALAH